MDRSVLERKSVAELRDIASALQLTGVGKLRKAELVDAIISNAEQSGEQSDDHESDDSKADDSKADDSQADDNQANESKADDSEADDEDERDDGDSRTRRRRTRSRERSGGGQDADAKGSSDTGGDGSGGGNTGRNQGRDSGGRDSGGRDSGGRDSSGGDNSGDDGRNRGRGGKSGNTSGRGRKDDDAGEVRAGVLDILPEGYGFLRTTGYLPGERDVYVSQGQIRKQRLRRGDVVQGPIRQQRSNEKVPALHHVEKVNLEELEDNRVADRPDFDQIPLAPLTADIDLGDANSINARLIDLVAPQADGQRTVVTVPPEADGAAFLIELAGALSQARPDSHLMLVSIDCRPEAVRAAAELVDGEVIASTFDQSAEDHTQIAELAIERAKRLVELGHDVIVLLDSISRLSRAYGVASGTGGRSVAPDIEAAALYPSKQLVAAARATDDDGSLTLIGTLLTDTGSVYDEVVQREFIRVANSVVTLDRQLAANGAAGIVSVVDSSTYAAATAKPMERTDAVSAIRESISRAGSTEATMVVVDRLQGTNSTEAFLSDVQATPLALPGGDGA
ncbi:transcription termination factor Rho [Euzebya tangerina]|uniref:transcription termination factor Rho n=1 Tax=Euzebya tangerina TaxID=591198 RepID=UPI000E31E8CD|nr:transcription termination factor Rho [Euzebya tangerina]